MKTTTYLISGLLVALAVTGCKKGKTPAAGIPVPEIAVATPIQQEVTYTYEYPAYLEAEQTVNLVARVPGFLEQIEFTPGQTVKTGQMLFVIEPGPYNDNVNAAKANVTSAEAKSAYARASYEKMKDAVKTKAVSEIDYIQSESVWQAAQAALTDTKAQLNSARINLAYCYIKAPFDGRISRNMIDRGNFVGSVAQPTQLAILYRDKKMLVYFNMAYAEYQNLQISKNTNTYTDSVIISDVSNPGKTWKGRLDYTSPNVDLNTGTVNIRAIIDNPRQELLSGMYVKVRIPYKKVNDALLIPESSIGTNQSGRFVYTVNQNSVVDFNPVKVGVLENNGMREIVSGITKNDRYVVNALMSVRAGSHIKVKVADER